MAVSLAMGGGLAHNAQAATKANKLSVKPTPVLVESCAPAQEVSNGTINRCIYMAKGLVRKRVAITEREYSSQKNNQIITDDITTTKVTRYFSHPKPGHSYIKSVSRSVKQKRYITPVPTLGEAPVPLSDIAPAVGQSAAIAPAPESRPTFDTSEPVCHDAVTQADKYCSPAEFQAEQACDAQGGQFRFSTDPALADYCDLGGSSAPLPRN